MMKNENILKEMENFDLETLERLSSDEKVPVPQDLEQSLDRLVTRLSVAEKILSPEEEPGAAVPLEKSHPFRWRNLWTAVASIAAGLLLVAGVNTMTDLYVSPEDTYKDPQEAYMEIERVLGLISDKMSPATEGLSQLDARFREQMDLFKK